MTARQTPPRRGRGRPAHVPTAANRRKVEELTMCGMSKEQQALALEISTETLIKHYTAELTYGAAKKQAEVYTMLFKSARKGSATAQRYLHQLGAVTLAQMTFAGGPSRQSEEERAEETPETTTPDVRGTGGYVSKKAVANQVAKTAGIGTEWGEDLTNPDAAARKPN